jgi:hypothetical protein
MLKEGRKEGKKKRGAEDVLRPEVCALRLGRKERRTVKGRPKGRKDDEKKEERMREGKEGRKNGERKGKGKEGREEG